MIKHPAFAHFLHSFDKAVRFISVRKTPRISGFLKKLKWKLILTLSVFGFGVWYIYDTVSRDALVIDYFSVPKQFQEAGFTPDVVATRVGTAMQEINADAHAQIEKNEVTWARDEGSIPDVEVPGTNLGLKALIQIARQLPFVNKPKYVVGDIVALHTSQTISVTQVAVTVYLRNHHGNQVIRFVAKSDDIELLTRSIAERIWEEVKPYVLASHLHEQGNSEEALKLARRIIADLPPENSQVPAAYALIGEILSDQHNYEEAVQNFKKSIALNPNSAFPVIAWGNALASQGNNFSNQGNTLAAEQKYDEGIELYKEAIRINPKSPNPYNNWGNTLRYQKKYEGAIAMYQEALRRNPRFALAYNNWGNALVSEGNDLKLGNASGAMKKYDEAIARYQRANDIDPRLTNLRWWGRVLFFEGKNDEAILRYQKAIELQPKAVNGYIYWGEVLASEKRYREAIEKYEMAIKIKPHNADAYRAWGNALREQGRVKAAEEKLARARELEE